MRTLVIIKPDIVGSGKIGEIISILEKNRLRIVAMRMEKLTVERAKEFYREHEGKDFFERLIDFMTSGYCIPMVVESEGDTVEMVREIIGNTDPSKAKPGTIRYMYGTNLPMNAIHASDSPDSAKREISFFFGSEYC